MPACLPACLLQLLPPLAEQTQALQLQQRNTGRSALAPGPHAPNPNDLWLDVYSANALSRVGGSGRRLQPVPCRLVVDVREFMSGLPAVLHQQGFRLTPITLEVRGGVEVS
jgi:DNA excision repair protein ERCC-4